MYKCQKQVLLVILKNIAFIHVHGYIQGLGPHTIKVIYIRGTPRKMDFLSSHWSELNNYLLGNVEDAPSAPLRSWAKMNILVWLWFKADGAWFGLYGRTVTSQK